MLAGSDEAARILLLELFQQASFFLMPDIHYPEKSSIPLNRRAIYKEKKIIMQLKLDFAQLAQRTDTQQHPLGQQSPAPPRNAPSSMASTRATALLPRLC
jgi:hypothetical protein